MSVTDWSPQPSGNAVADRAIPALDGMAGRQVPEAIRGVMAKAAALALDQGGALVSTGSGNAYAVSTNSGFTEIKPGVSLSFWADRDNTDAPTLNVDGRGPNRLLSAEGLELPGGAIQAGILYAVIWSAALPGSVPAWRLSGAAGGAVSTGLIGFDFSGLLSERAQYDGQPKNKVFMAVADTPTGPSWTLYVKRSNAFGDWSSGLPIKASPAQTTLDAQAAAFAAAQQRDAAAAQAQAAAAERVLAQQQATLSANQAAASADQAGAAATQANAAALSATEARDVVSLIGLQVFDFSFDSEATPTDDWSN